jgi:hypothetical protein
MYDINVGRSSIDPCLTGTVHVKGLHLVRSCVPDMTYLLITGKYSLYDYNIWYQCAVQSVMARMSNLLRNWDEDFILLCS